GDDSERFLGVRQDVCRPSAESPPLQRATTGGALLASHRTPPPPNVKAQRPAQRVRCNRGLGARSPSQIVREPLQGSRQFLIFKVPQGPACRILAEQPE